MKAMQYLSFAAALLISLSTLPAADISPEKEAEQLAILRSDAPAAQKAVACKKLAIDGSKAAVPDLEKLLPDPQLSSWARIALETIPGPEADAALRKAAESLDGRLLIGMLNSIGVRRDAGAVELLAKRLTNADADVASAAAVALGRIGNAEATKTLRAQLATAPAKVRSAVAEGCVLCAEQLVAAGKSTEAAELYEAVRTAKDLPKQRVIEATRGVILARKQDGLPLLLEQLRSADKHFFQLALGTAREFPGSELDKALAGELAKLSPDRAALVVTAMADRPQTVVLASVLQAAGPGPKPVRLAAIAALARIGDDTCLTTLLDAADDSDGTLATAAKAALADLPGKKVDAQIAELLAKAQGKRFSLLIGLVGQRRIDAVTTLVKSLDHADKSVRDAALTALGETVDLPRLNVLIARVVSPKATDDATIAQNALKAACVRMPDRDACATELAAALNRSPEATKELLVDILGEVGGAKALQTLGAAAKGSDATLQDAGSRVLGKWNSVDAAPVLLDLAKNGPTPQYRTRGLRGYIGLVRKFAMPDEQRAAMCQSALDLARQPAEQKLVLDVLKLYPSKDTLAVAIKTMQVPAVKDDASQAVLLIAAKAGKGAEITAMLNKAGFERVKLEIVKADYGSGSTQRDVTSILRKEAGDLPVVTLPKATYNASFGGDPLPNAVKKLTVQYRLNGKLGTATFAEDAVIVLPMP